MLSFHSSCYRISQSCTSMDHLAYHFSIRTSCCCNPSPWYHFSLYIFIWLSIMCISSHELLSDSQTQNDWRHNALATWSWSASGRHLPVACIVFVTTWFVGHRFMSKFARWIAFWCLLGMVGFANSNLPVRPLWPTPTLNVTTGLAEVDGCADFLRGLKLRSAAFPVWPFCYRTHTCY